MKNIFRISGVILLMNLIFSCKKEEKPTLTTMAITNIEWATMKNFLGGENIADGNLKEAVIVHWKSPNIREQMKVIYCSSRRL